jgi:hypothetical protein
MLFYSVACDLLCWHWASARAALLRKCDDGGVRWVGDDLLDDEQRAVATLFLTPRTGHDLPLCWPLDELDGGAP